MHDKVNEKKYLKKVKEITPPSPFIKNALSAFFSGGAVCTLGELLYNLFSYMNFSEKDARTCVSVTLIFLTAVLTGAGVYDKLAARAGAGLGVPISGFANSVCSPAIEHSAEGYIHGTAVKMFSLAGPVIVFGCSSAAVYGIIYYIFEWVL